MVHGLSRWLIKIRESQLKHQVTVTLFPLPYTSGSTTDYTNPTPPELSGTKPKQSQGLPFSPARRCYPRILCGAITFENCSESTIVVITPINSRPDPAGPSLCLCRTTREHTTLTFRVYTSDDTRETDKSTHACAVPHAALPSFLPSCLFPAPHLLCPLSLSPPRGAHIPDSADRKTPCSASWLKALKITAREKRKWHVMYVLR